MLRERSDETSISNTTGGRKFSPRALDAALIKVVLGSAFMPEAEGTEEGNRCAHTLAGPPFVQRQGRPRGTPASPVRVSRPHLQKGDPTGGDSVLCLVCRVAGLCLWAAGYWPMAICCWLLSRGCWRRRGCSCWWRHGCCIVAAGCWLLAAVSWCKMSRSTIVGWCLLIGGCWLLLVGLLAGSWLLHEDPKS